jgi:hypothetical protein
LLALVTEHVQTFHFFALLSYGVGIISESSLYLSLPPFYHHILTKEVTP